MTLGNRLQNLRREKGLTQAHLGAYFNLAESTISLYESGKRSPDYDTLKRLASFFSVSLDYLLGISDNRQLPSQLQERSVPYKTRKNAPVQARLPVIISLKRNPQGVINEEKGSTEEYYWDSNPDEGRCYWFKVNSDSMRNEGILPGDLVLIREQTRLKYGEIGLVLVDKEPGNLYRVYSKENSIVLQNSNPSFPARIFTGKEFSRVIVMGRVMEIRRKI
jgi:repressor LexA